MGLELADRVMETTTTTGTGDITLAGAVTGYRAFSAIVTTNDDQFPYVIFGGTEWESGIGKRLSSTTFSRTVISSSNSNALVSFSSGTKYVYLDSIQALIVSM